MVLSLIAGRKLQTRRLAASPLRNAKPGDRFYVREHWKTFKEFDVLKPTKLVEAVRDGSLTTIPTLYVADGAWLDDRHAALDRPIGKFH